MFVWVVCADDFGYLSSFDVNGLQFLGDPIYFSYEDAAASMVDCLDAEFGENYSFYYDMIQIR